MGNKHVYADGYCCPNPNGTAVWAFVVLEGEKELFADQGLVLSSRTTNILAEYTALEKALSYIDENLPGEKVNLFCESQLVLYQVRGKWNTHAEHLIPLRNRCQQLYRENPGVRLFLCAPGENRANALTRRAFRLLAGIEMEDCPDTFPEKSKYVKTTARPEPVGRSR